MSGHVAQHRNEAEASEVRATLAWFGAPLLVARSGASMSLEHALVRSLALAHDDSTLFRVLPVVILRNRDALALEAIERRAALEGRLAEWGMLLDLAGDLAGDRMLGARAEAIRRALRHEDRGFFFAVRSRAEAELAEKRTPAAVRRWGYRMNLPEESLRAWMGKFA